MTHKDSVQEFVTARETAGATPSLADAHADDDGRATDANRQTSRGAESERQLADQLVLRAATAKTRENMLTLLSRAIELDPDHETARQAMYRTLQLQLEDDAFLAYLAENERAYHVTTADKIHVVVPKERAVVPPYPPAKPGPLAPALRWLKLALLGLLLSGLGAILFAPLALLSLLSIPGSSLSRDDQRRRVIFGALTLVLWFLGWLLGLFILIHL